MKLNLLATLLIAAAGLWLSVSQPAVAQNTTIQQPTFNYNTVNTTVTAPDGGTVNLGSIKRASSGRTSQGVPILGKLPGVGRLFRNTGIGQDYQHLGQSVTPRIIILEEEEAKLGLQNFGSGTAGGVLGATDSRSRPSFEETYRIAPRQLNETDVQALRLSQHVSNNFVAIDQLQDDQATTVDDGPTAEEIRRQNELAAQARDHEANKFYQKGRDAEEAGKANVAKIYYKMAARRATGDFRIEIQTRLDAVAGQ